LSGVWGDEAVALEGAEGSQVVQGPEGEYSVYGLRYDEYLIKANLEQQIPFLIFLWR
jgi:hypothetical protein